MKKLILTSVIALFSVLFANAQFKLEGSFGPTFPTGDFGDAVKGGMGFTLTGSYCLEDNSTVGLQTGYMGFGEKDDLGLEYSIIPITLNTNYYFLKGKIKPFLGGDLGLYLLKPKMDGVDGDSETKFGVAVHGGIEAEVSKNLSVNLKAKDTYIFIKDTSLGYISTELGIAYKF